MPASQAGTVFHAGHAQDPIAFGTSGYNYPAAAWVDVFTGRNGSGALLVHHHIYYEGTPASDSDFNNAPNGSYFTDLTNFKLYIKTAASTWTVVGAQS